MKKVSLLALFVALTFVFGMVPADVQAKTTFVTIGTGGITGVYYPTGGAIAKMVNAKRKAYGIRATVESTGGSVFNINAVMSGDLEFGVVQSDRQFQALKGMAEWAGKPQPDLRAVFSIHPETVTLAPLWTPASTGHQGPQGQTRQYRQPGVRPAPESIDALEANGMNYEKDSMAENQGR
jgi:TRAP transporter TAXI family solute receptor